MTKAFQAMVIAFAVIVPSIMNASEAVTTSSQTLIFPGAPGMQLKDLPGAVQQTFMQRAAGANIERITRTDRGNRVVYRIRSEQDGVRTTMEITQDGSLLTLVTDFSGSAGPIDAGNVSGSSGGY